jgi:SSS family solute:Na+ symporter
MNHPGFAEQSQAARDILAGISDDTIRNQASVTIALKYILPNGLIGGLCAVMLAATIATHDTYMHSWGSVFVQDVILPFRRKPLTQPEHIKWLKISILGVAVFIFVFSIFFRQSEAIVMFFQITGAIFVGGAGSVIIGGLYWNRGTTAGAWAGMLSGSILAVGGIVLKQIHQYLPFENSILLKIVSLNGAYIGFVAAVTAIIMYIFISLLSGKEKYDLDKLLHRGAYMIKEDSTQVTAKPVGKLLTMIGINSDFNTKDKIIYLGMFFWTLFLVVLFVAITVISVIEQLSDKFWIGFWKYYIVISFVLAVIATVWFLLGGLSDLKKMFGRLRERDIDESDDGYIKSK